MRVRSGPTGFAGVQKRYLVEDHLALIDIRAFLRRRKMREIGEQWIEWGDV